MAHSGPTAHCCFRLVLETRVLFRAAYSPTYKLYFPKRPQQYPPSHVLALGLSTSSHERWGSCSYSRSDLKGRYSSACLFLELTPPCWEEAQAATQRHMWVFQLRVPAESPATSQHRPLDMRVNGLQMIPVPAGKMPHASPPKHRGTGQGQAIPDVLSAFLTHKICEPDRMTALPTSEWFIMH